MCLAIPGKIIDIFEEDGLRMGKIDYSGTMNTACLEYLPEAKIGEYVIVHAGFAISALDESEAEKTLELWGELMEKADQEELDMSGIPPGEDRVSGK